MWRIGKQSDFSNRTSHASIDNTPKRSHCCSSGSIRTAPTCCSRLSGLRRYYRKTIASENSAERKVCRPIQIWSHRRITTIRQDRQHHRAHIQHRFLTAAQTARQTIGSRGRPVSSATIRRRLRERGLRAHVPYRGQILNPQRRGRRLRWARGNQRWTLVRLRSALFTDESRIKYA